jgi:hypothetical protein
MERLKQLGQMTENNERVINQKICIWCVNRGCEACVTQCQVEGKYLHLCPDEIEDWEPGPKLPAFKELSSWSPQERLAILYLVYYYQSSRG